MMDKQGGEIKSTWTTLVVVSVLIVLACGRPDDLDLSETYFPMGMGYTWIYERTTGGWESGVDENGESIDNGWSSTSTLRVSITDSFTVFRGWEFKTSGEFRDVGTNPRIIGNKIVIFDRKKPFEPKETGNVGLKGFEITYSDEVLCLSLKDGKELTSSGVYTEGTDITTLRIKGLGIVYQNLRKYATGHASSGADYVTDRLLYFIKDGDTVWNHEDTITNVVF